MLIAVDFDHTLVNIDKPLPGAKEAMQRLRDAGHRILIYSCNGIDWIRKVLNNNDIPYDSIWGDSIHDSGKPICGAYIDDRAVAFTGDWDVALKDIANLEERRKKIKGLI